MGDIILSKKKAELQADLISLRKAFDIMSHKKIKLLINTDDEIINDLMIDGLLNKFEYSVELL
jgi:hypothetical protein